MKTGTIVVDSPSKRMLKAIFAGVAVAILIAAAGVTALIVVGSYLVPELKGPDAAAVYAITQRPGTTLEIKDLLADRDVTRACIIPVGDRISGTIGNDATEKLNLYTEFDEANWVIFSEKNGAGRIELVSRHDIGIRLEKGFCTSSFDGKVMLDPCPQCSKGILINFGR